MADANYVFPQQRINLDPLSISNAQWLKRTKLNDGALEAALIINVKST
jgi:hypothetical protein